MGTVTLKDLSKKLDLSPSTVSRALNDHPAISQTTKERVRELAAELKYQPNQLARGLHRKRTQVIGVLVPEIRHDFFSAVISGIEEIMYNAGFTIMVCQSMEDSQREIETLEAMLAHQISGLLISISENTKNNAPFISALDRGYPIVFFDRVFDNLDASCVVVDDFDGAFQAVQHLIQSGYREIGYIGGAKNLNIQRKRLHGYKEALKENNIGINKDWIVSTGLNEKDGITGARILLNSKKFPRAIFCINDPVAMGVYSVVREKGLRIPDDVAIIGFTDDPIVRLLDPPLSTISQPKVEMGKSAARLLLEQITHSEEEFVPRVVTLKTRLVVRGST